ncbi:MAG: hypothetical protein OJJ55_18635 [Rhodococcus sp.]|nr:hypothetical protein [Rhodococcus sp. (in: high G+C Gram-positive bacteria)]
MGAAPRERFEYELEAVETAFARLELGLADLTVISIPSPKQLRLQREGDPSRRRRHFELHAALAEPLSPTGTRRWTGWIQVAFCGASRHCSIFRAVPRLDRIAAIRASFAR